MTKVFEPRGIGGGLKGQLDAFMAEWDFRCLYKLYNWGRDNHSDGFPDILQMEIQLTSHAKAGGVTEDDIRSVLIWGGRSGRRRVGRFTASVKPPLSGAKLYSPNGAPIAALKLNPFEPVRELRQNTSHIGPTYLSKVLRFALPQEYGAIDTRCAQAFDSWVPLTVRDYGYGPYIAEDGKWPDGYSIWINILRYIAHKLNAKQINCPHPKGFVDAGLRDGKTWTCADVEMALFSYATHMLDPQKLKAILKCRVVNTDDNC